MRKRRRYLRRKGRLPEHWFPVIAVLLRRNVGRSWQICGTRFYGERILIGTAARIRAPAPASRALTVGQNEAPLPPAKGSLAGVVVSGNSPSPVKECWPELGADAEAVLRRTRARRRWQYLTLACSGENTLYGSWGFPPVNGLLTGVGLPVIVFPPAGECWPELADLWRALLR